MQEDDYLMVNHWVTYEGVVGLRKGALHYNFKSSD